MGGDIALTHAGIREIEDSRRRPNHPTEHFGTTVIQYVQNFSGAQIGAVQMGANSTANVQQNTGAQLSELTPLLEALLSEGRRTLAAEQAEEFRELVEDVRDELGKTKPKKSRLGAYVGHAYKIALGATTLAPKVMDLATRLGLQL